MATVICSKKHSDWPATHSGAGITPITTWLINLGNACKWKLFETLKKESLYNGSAIHSQTISFIIVHLNGETNPRQKKRQSMTACDNCLFFFTWKAWEVFVSCKEAVDETPWSLKDLIHLVKAGNEV